MEFLEVCYPVGQSVPEAEHAIQHTGQEYAVIIEGALSTQIGFEQYVLEEGDSLTFDFTGSSPQSKYSVNCSKWASLGGLFAPLFPLLCFDIVWNEGAIRPIKMIAPEGTIVNCTRPAPNSP